MIDARHNETAIATERAVLRVLCGSGISILHAETLDRLRQYAWVDADHQLVFSALLRLAKLPLELLPARLPAEAARMGFPDVNWDSYFAPAAASEPNQNLSQLLRQMLPESAARQ